MKTDGGGLGCLPLDWIGCVEYWSADAIYASKSKAWLYVHPGLWGSGLSVQAEQSGFSWLQTALHLVLV